MCSFERHPLDLALHHIGILVRDISKRAALYSSRFGYQIRTEIVRDVTQTAYVQFLQLPADSIYLELISPDGPKSKLTNALTKGEGLNHLCYSTPAIDADCARLRSEGLHLVSAPVPASAFAGRRVAWLMGADGVLVELVERGGDGEL
jgi:methylmalonyl-CoA/ethylmalonyl-CoA epimerase